jgi:Domain of unknown function (DUF4342)
MKGLDPMTDQSSGANQPPKSDETRKRTVIETIEVSGAQLIDSIKDIIKASNVRTLRIRAGDDFKLEMPVSVGVIGGGVVVLAAPWLAVLGAIAAMVSHVKIDIERDGDDDDKPVDPNTSAKP